MGSCIALNIKGYNAILREMGCGMIEGLDHINIVVSDLERAKRFFEMFGFTEIDASELRGEWISTIVKLKGVVARYVALALPASELRIELIKYENPASVKAPDLGKANKIGLRHLAFRVNDIEKEVERLKRNGVEFLSEVMVYKKLGKKLVYFCGPDGILLELAEYSSDN
ncbi:MAG: VOC family protein [Deltaproteobacteria bacterium]|nr:VOC family protein [Deltaproteobacteria bacterium]MBW2025909.1 VOC family protein [Deltaproteobacteria bacterium]